HARLLTALQLAIPYDRYGKFDNVGGPDYAYKLKDAVSLKRHLHRGIYPNVNPAGAEEIDANILDEKSRVWAIPVKECLDFWGNFDPNSTFDKRYTQGVRQYNYAVCLERSGRWREAIEAYYATVVHFPADMDPNRNFPAFYTNYLGVRAMDAVYLLTRLHPAQGLRYLGGEIRIENGFDASETNDILRIWPGRLVEVAPSQVNPAPQGLEGQPIVARKQFSTNIELVKYFKGHWQVLVDGRPFLVKGVHYMPPPDMPGPAPNGFWNKLKDKFTVQEGDFMTDPENAAQYWTSGWTRDLDESGVPDIEEAWLDANKNKVKDPGEPALGDFGLMKLAGANTAVLSNPPEDTQILEKIYEKTGIYFIISESLNTDRTIAPEPWMRRVNYADPVETRRELARISELVERHRDKNYLLFWSLGGYSVHSPEGGTGRVNKKAYYDFAGKVIKRIKELDANHPVVFTIQDIFDLPATAVNLREADILGVSSCRGFHGFGQSMWQELRELWGKPVVMMDFGAPAFAEGVDAKEAEKLQSVAHKRAWADIFYHRAGAGGAGLAVGGCAWEWNDGWWRDMKDGVRRAAVHDARAGQKGPFIDGKDYPEWHGLLGLADGPKSAAVRTPRKVYWMYSRIWRNE
ncbi:MAG: hypothetical protein HY747_07245, partial [Elusimicrobia bacterium]|nr:hypothetical protein [Elusimicrobiota bacterium]